MSADAVTSGLRCGDRVAMGSRVAVAADLPQHHVDAALDLIAELEQLWSRFVEGSEINAINQSDGLVVVDRRTAGVVALGLEGRAITGGWYDPTLAGRPVAADPVSGLVMAAGRTELDLGGIGKGRAADLAAAFLGGRGAGSAIVSVGGDVGVVANDPVSIEVESPAGQGPAPARLLVRSAGIAMSGPTRQRDHLVDPHEGRACARPRVALVIAGSAAGAEMLATAAAVGPVEDVLRFLSRVDASGWLIEHDGAMVEFGDPARFVHDWGWLAHSQDRKWSRGVVSP